MVDLIFDNSFEGFLCCIFTIYDRKISTCTIVDQDRYTERLFAEKLFVETNNKNAERVWEGVRKQSSKKICNFIYSVFLSESLDVYQDIAYFIQCIFRGESYRVSDYGDNRILNLHKAKKMIGREVHRMHAFVRFQETKDGIYTAIMNPDFNVLPLSWKHFKDRYPAMDWLLYDNKRSYGVYYSEGKIKTITYEEDIELNGVRISSDKLTDEELQYQEMWKAYFQSVNIKERNNTKLHERHVPRRYWSYLVEKW